MSDRAKSRSLQGHNIRTDRLGILKIASTKVVAIFFFACSTVLGQTGQVRAFLFDSDTKALLIGNKVGLQINDTVSASFHYADSAGRVILKLKPGQYNLAIKPEGYELMKAENVIVKENEATFLTFSFEKAAVKKHKRKNTDGKHK